eukprot:scaffold5138_cov251-Pinguiococcus_pyrenoidosus.AAC.3
MRFILQRLSCQNCSLHVDAHHRIADGRNALAGKTPGWARIFSVTWCASAFGVTVSRVLGRTCQGRIGVAELVGHIDDVARENDVAVRDVRVVGPASRQRSKASAQIIKHRLTAEVLRVRNEAALEAADLHHVLVAFAVDEIVHSRQERPDRRVARPQDEALKIWTELRCVQIHRPIAIVDVVDQTTRSRRNLDGLQGSREPHLGEHRHENALGAVQTDQIIAWKRELDVFLGQVPEMRHVASVGEAASGRRLQQLEVVRHQVEAAVRPDRRAHDDLAEEGAGHVEELVGARRAQERHGRTRKH